MRARYQYRHISSRRMLGGREVKPAHTSRRNGRTLKVRWYKHMPISPGGNSAWRHAVVLPVAVSVIFTVYWRCLPASRPGELHSPSGAREYRLLQRIFGRPVERTVRVELQLEYNAYRCSRIARTKRQASRVAVKQCHHSDNSSISE